MLNIYFLDIFTFCDHVIGIDNKLLVFNYDTNQMFPELLLN